MTHPATTNATNPCSQKSVSFASPPPGPASGGSPLASLIRGMWASREMLHENSDKQLFMKTTLRELILYCVFLFVIVYMTFGQYSSDFYLLRSRIDQLFEKQDKVTQMKDFWVFVEGDLLDGLYWEKLYNKGRKVTEFRCWHLPLPHLLLLQVPLDRAEGAVPGAPLPLSCGGHRQEHDVREQDAGCPQVRYKMYM